MIHTCFSAEPIRIFYGASDEREIFNATTITVPSTDSPRLLRLKFVASSAQVRGMENGLFNLPTSFHDVLLTPSTASLTATHLLEVTGSGSITVYGVSAITNNTHYNLTYIVYFDGESTKSSMSKLTNLVHRPRLPVHVTLKN